MHLCPPMVPLYTVLYSPMLILERANVVPAIQIPAIRGVVSKYFMLKNIANNY